MMLVKAEMSFYAVRLTTLMIDSLVAFRVVINETFPLTSAETRKPEIALTRERFKINVIVSHCIRNRYTDLISLRNRNGLRFLIKQGCIPTIVYMLTGVRCRHLASLLNDG